MLSKIFRNSNSHEVCKHFDPKIICHFSRSDSSIYIYIYLTLINASYVVIYEHENRSDKRRGISYNVEHITCYFNRDISNTRVDKNAHFIVQCLKIYNNE
jgi:hypothetical protein